MGLGSVIDLREGRYFSFFGLLGSPSLTIVNRDGSTQDFTRLGNLIYKKTIIDPHG